MKALLGVLLLFVLAGCGASGTSSSSLIVVNKRIGPVVMGEPRPKVEAALGRGTVIKTHKRDANGGGTVLVSYPAASFRVVYSTRGGKTAVFAMETTSSRYRTKSGVGVGSTLSDVKKIGADCTATSCSIGHSDGGGVVTYFSLDRSGTRVTRVQIFVEFG